MSSADDPTSGKHKHNTLEDFQPLVPTVSPSHRLQHISNPQGSSAAFGYLVAKQWHADIANNRATWAVVGTDVEAHLLCRDIAAGAVTETPLSAINRESILLSVRAGDCARLPRTGQLVIMPFSHLREFLFLGLFVDLPLLSWIDTFGSPTIVMDFNWGKVTFDMAFSCSLIAKYAKASINKRSNFIMACTVSDNTTSYFGEINQHMEAQYVTTPFDTRSVKLRFCEENLPVRLGGEPNPDAANLAFNEAIMKRSGTENEPREKEGRFLFITDWQELPEGIQLRELNSMDLNSTRAADSEYFRVDRGMSYVGCASNLSSVIIWPFSSSEWGLCEGQPTLFFFPHSTARSQAEVHYYSRYMHGIVDPEVTIMGTEEQFNTCLPALCETPPAHTVDLTALLICCKLLWPRTAISKIPVYLPPDKQRLASQVGTLITKGILKTVRDESTPESKSELSILDTKTSLTTTGKTIATLLKGTLEDPHGAHLLAQLLDPDGPDAALSQTSEAVVNAVLSLIAITEAHREVTGLNETINLQKDTRGDDLWYSTQLHGVGAGEAWRGPIWLALSIWQRMRADPTWRHPPERYDEEVEEHRLLLNNGKLLVYMNLTFEWDDAFEIAVDAAKARGLAVPELSDTARLTTEEMLAVEKALVRAYLDQIIYATASDGSEPKLKHLLTRRSIRRPFDSQARQIWWSECQKRNALLRRDRPPACLFFIYTHKGYGKDETLGDSAPIPHDVTYVSFSAVELVLEEAGKLELMPGRRQESTSRGLKRGNWLRGDG